MIQNVEMMSLVYKTYQIPYKTIKHVLNSFNAISLETYREG